MIDDRQDLGKLLHPTASLEFRPFSTYSDATVECSGSIGISLPRKPFVLTFAAPSTRNTQRRQRKLKKFWRTTSFLLHLSSSCSLYQAPTLSWKESDGSNGTMRWVPPLKTFQTSGMHSSTHYYYNQRSGGVQHLALLSRLSNDRFNGLKLKRLSILEMCNCMQQSRKYRTDLFAAGSTSKRRSRRT